MIPKTIHYCWFGKGNKSDLVKKCINSWSEKLSDYEIKEWNEDNFDVTVNDFIKTAYERKKWAFVSDYCRVHILYESGGIYLDTDVEVIKSFNDLLQTSFIGYEQKQYLCTAAMGFEKDNTFMERMCALYQSGEFDLNVPNSKHFYNELNKAYHLPDISESPIIVQGIKIYPAEWFSPKDYATKKVNITENTHCIHHFDGTWKNNREKIKDSIQNTLIRMLGRDRYYNWKGKLKR